MTALKALIFGMTAVLVVAAGASVVLWKESISYEAAPMIWDLVYGSAIAGASIILATIIYILQR